MTIAASIASSRPVAVRSSAMAAARSAGVGAANRDAQRGHRGRVAFGWRPWLLTATAFAALVGFVLLLPTPEVGPLAAAARAGSADPAATGSSDTLPSGRFVVRDVRLFDGERFVERASVWVADGRIERVETTASAASAADGGVHNEETAAIPVVAGEGRTLLPGLIDAHTHSWGDALERAVVFGVTTQLDQFGNVAEAVRLAAEQVGGQVALAAAAATAVAEPVSSEPVSSETGPAGAQAGEVTGLPVGDSPAAAVGDAGAPGAPSSSSSSAAALPRPLRADLFSAGTLVTRRGGHGTQFGIPIPTLEAAAAADAFVAARLAEGSAWIKLVIEDGHEIGLPRRLPTLDAATVAAVVTAAHRRGALVVAHVHALAAAEMAVAAGVDGLVHTVVDEVPSVAFAQDLARRGVFVVPTLSVLGGLGLDRASGAVAGSSPTGRGAAGAAARVDAGDTASPAASVNARVSAAPTVVATGEGYDCGFQALPAGQVSVLAAAGDGPSLAVDPHLAPWLRPGERAQLAAVARAPAGASAKPAAPEGVTAGTSPPDVSGPAATAPIVTTPAATTRDASTPHASIADASAPTGARATVPCRPSGGAVARASVARFAAAGVTLLTGTDAGNPGTTWGASQHGELALLVAAGIDPASALAGATAAAARAFRLADRGRIAPGQRADLLLVAGDPAVDITATRAIVAVWKDGRLVPRPRPETVPSLRLAAAGGVLVDFEDGVVSAAPSPPSPTELAAGSAAAPVAAVDGGRTSAHPAGDPAGTSAGDPAVALVASTDAMMGGTSTVELVVVSVTAGDGGRAARLGSNDVPAAHSGSLAPATVGDAEIAAGEVAGTAGTTTQPAGWAAAHRVVPSTDAYLRVTGTIQPSFAFPWAGGLLALGRMFGGGASAAGGDPMPAVDLGDRTRLELRARGDALRVLVLVDGVGRPFEAYLPASTTWQRHTVDLRALGVSPEAVRAILFVGGPGEGPFRFELDDIGLWPPGDDAGAGGSDGVSAVGALAKANAKAAPDSAAAAGRE